MLIKRKKTKKEQKPYHAAHHCSGLLAKASPAHQGQHCLLPPARRRSSCVPDAQASRAGSSLPACPPPRLPGRRHAPPDPLVLSPLSLDLFPLLCSLSLSLSRQPERSRHHRRRLARPPSSPGVVSVPACSAPNPKHLSTDQRKAGRPEDDAATFLPRP